MDGFTYQKWEIDALWGRISFFELASGFVFFCMNVLHSKDILGIICMKKNSVYRGEGEQADAYLIYLPHG